jgi:type III secretion protein F
MTDITQPTQAASGASTADFGFLSQLSAQFDEGNATLNKRASDLLDQLQQSGQASNPALLARYQSAFTEQNLYRNLQSSVVKKWGDTDATIISNYR